MYPLAHFLFAFVIGLFLSKLNLISWQMALTTGIIGMSIDIDHYIKHILFSKTNRLSLVSTWNTSVHTHRLKLRSFIHSTKGLLLITLLLIILSIYDWRYGLTFAIGYYSHLLLDYLDDRIPKTLRWKLGKLHLDISYLEIILSCLLFILVILLIAL